MPASTSLDKVAAKVKLVAVPSNIVEKDVYSPADPEAAEGAPLEPISAKNTNERAVVRLTIPKRKVEEPEDKPVEGEESKEEKKEDKKEDKPVEVPKKEGEEPKVEEEEKWVEIELEDKVLLLQARNDAAPYAIFVLHKAAPRWHRKEMMTVVKKYCTEFEGADIDALTQKVELVADNFEDKWIENYCDEDKLPLFDFDINLNDNE